MNDLPVVLGTVQLGGAYGIANRTGRPDLATARAMVEAALAGGIHAFDTAAAYGDSEQVLGRVLADLGRPDVTIITKLEAFPVEILADADAAARHIERSVTGSARRLGVERIPVVLFHREQDAAHLGALLTLRDRGLVGRVGVSCAHDPRSAQRWIADAGVEVVQLPLSIVDRRHLDGGALRAAVRSGVEVHARSAFLQGLLLMPEPDIPGALAAVIPVRRELERLAATAGLTMAELAVRYVLGLPGDIRVVLGAETVAQVRENARLAARGRLAPDVQEAVAQVVPRLPDTVITPGLWAGAA